MIPPHRSPIRHRELGPPIQKGRLPRVVFTIFIPQLKKPQPLILGHPQGLRPPPHDECLDHEQPWLANHPAGNYMPKANNRNTRTRSEICSKLTIKTPERRQWHYSGIFIANPEHIPHPAPVPPLLTRSR